MDEPYEIDYAPIKVLLADIPEALVNRIKRERDAELSASHRTLPGVLSLMTNVVRVTWDSVRFLCANTVDRPGRRLEFDVAIPPLSRTILDAIFNVVFIFDKPSVNARWYCAGGWREAAELQSRLTARYGAREDWKEFLKDHETAVAGFAEDADVTPHEAASPTLVKYWPHPGVMLRESVEFADPARRAFLSFLKAWFYGHLSGDSHLGLMGLARRAGHFVRFESDEQDNERRESLSRHHHQIIFNSMTIYVAYLSEVAGQLCLEHECMRLRQAWTHLQKWPEIQDLYMERYDSWLARRAG
jgi:hypothetical protein